MLAVMTDSETLYERVGGEQFFETLTRHFYDTMSDDQVVRPLYPDEAEAYETARLQLKWFLMQYWGGPPSTCNVGGCRRCDGATPPT